MVPATSPDILPDTPSGVSGGSKLAKITDGAVIFDGTSDYLSVADSDDFHLGTNDFTIEVFCIQKQHSGYIMPIMFNMAPLIQQKFPNGRIAFQYIISLEHGSSEHYINWSEGFH